MSDPNIRPNVDRVSGVPSCTETCPSHDGKRCRVLGLKAGGICEPAVIDIVVALRKTKATVEALDGAVNDALGALLDPDMRRVLVGAFDAVGGVMLGLAALALLEVDDA